MQIKFENLWQNTCEMVSNGYNMINNGILRPVAGGGAGGARAPPEIFRLELNSATKVVFFY